MNTVPIENTSCNVIEISRNIEMTEPKPKRKSRRNLYARTTDKVSQGHSADSIKSKEMINDFVLDILLKGDIYKANLFVFNCNTGFRNGDTLSFRVKDLTNPDGTVKDYITLTEDKTDKLRTVWLNDTVKKMLAFTIKTKGLTSENYVFRGDGNKKSWVEKLVVENGELIECKTTFDKYDEQGNEREIAPMLVGSVTRWLKGVCNQVGIEGKYSSHTFRQTYSYFISQGWTDNRYAMAACQDFGHSSLNITLAHYMGVSPQELKEHQLALNLGKEAVEMYITERNGSNVKS
jgi:integrase